PNNQQFNRRAIRRAIEKIRLENHTKYPHFRPLVGPLNFDNLVLFAKSYLEMIRELDLSKRII
ncbi:MAG: hypothetical protein AAF847_13855, partial [Bacteroidota bacterium]